MRDSRHDTKNNKSECSAHADDHGSRVTQPPRPKTKKGAEAAVVVVAWSQQRKENNAIASSTTTSTSTTHCTTGGRCTVAAYHDSAVCWLMLMDGTVHGTSSGTSK